MGSQNPSRGNDTVHILVTGFSPFYGNPINPSFPIASSLPPTLSSPSLPGTNIQIHAHPTPIRVSYKDVRQGVPALLFSRSDLAVPRKGLVPQRPMQQETSNDTPDGSHPPSSVRPNFDIVIHIGVAAKQNFFALEKCAHRDGYNDKDFDERTIKGDDFWEKEYKAPELLTTSFDTGDVWRRWKDGLSGEDVRLSDDAGHYLCDFLYYTSLVEYWRRDPRGKRPVMFLHVPGGVGEEDIVRGRNVTLMLIKALVESMKTRGVDGKENVRF